VFEGALRTAAISVVNRGGAPAFYRVALIRMRMSDAGVITPIATTLPAEAFADTLVRFAPRQMALGPNESQVIRIQLRRIPDLPTVEFRSHLVVQEIPPTPTLLSPVASVASHESEDPAGVQVRITTAFALAIPVIVRQGSLTASVSIADFRLLRRQGFGELPLAQLSLRREGNRSVYGDLRLTYVPEHGRPTLVGLVRGVSIYTPNRLRIIEVPLTLPPATPGTVGRLSVRYAESGRRAAIADASFIMP